MKFYEYCELTPHESNLEDGTVMACCYLEAKGLKFGVDFGFDNAYFMAERHYATESKETA
jgi:hypothetical protein